MPVTGPHCDGCPQQEVGEKRLLPDGKGTSGILIVGDSPWKDEVRLGRPFAGAAGSYLDRLIRMIGRKREDFLVTNTMCCKPQWLNWTDKDEAGPAIAQCGPYLDETVRAMKPKVIIPLGNVALRRCCGVSGIQARQAYVHESVWGIPAVPTFHPSFIMQANHKYFGAAAYAFKRAEEISQARAGVGGFVRAPVHYLVDVPVDDLRSYCDGHMSGTGPMVIDIETPISSKVDEETAEEDPSFTIVRVSISVAPFTAATFPWSEPYVSWLREMLPTRKQLVMWNASFDSPRLIANGVMINGEVIDAMWMWHFLQSDLPKSLGFVAPFFSDLGAWKHLSDSDLPLYSAMDSDATYRCYLGIRSALERQGRWGAFQTHCQRTGAVLNHMGPRGILIDRARQDALRSRLEGEHAAALAKLQLEVPDAVKKLKTWKKGPKVVTPQHITEVITCEKCGGVGAKAPVPPKPAQNVMEL